MPALGSSVAAEGWVVDDGSSRRRLRRALVASASLHAVLLLSWPAPLRPGVAVPPPSLIVSSLPSAAGIPAGEPAQATARSDGRAGSATAAAPVHPLGQAFVPPPRLEASPRLAVATGAWTVAEPSNAVPAAQAPAAMRPAVEQPLPAAGPQASSATPTAAAGVGVDSGAAGGSGVLSADDLRLYRMTLAIQARRFKRYPALARDRGWQGTVDVEVSGGGLLASPVVRLQGSSGYSVLDQQALEMIGQAARLSSLPDSLRQSGFRLVLPVTYRVDD